MAGDLLLGCRMGEAAFAYKRREPEKTLLYGIVRDHFIFAEMR